MKRITLALVAFMLVLGMTQCKKEQQNDIIPDEGETVYITMKVADDGGKHDVFPSTGAVVYGNGDVIYVGNNGHYVGTLTYANGAFSGTITSPSTSDYLHFYFTGGKTPAATPTTNTTSFTVSIADQSTKLPVLSYGHSTSKYVDGTTAYTCVLENKCGLVKFVPSQATSNPITVSGMKTTATIDFSTSSPGITPTDATGTVTLYSASSSEKWAILLPQNEVTTNIANGYTLAGSFTVPAIAANSYLNNGIALNLTPQGVLNGQFTINSAGDKVYFSQGNLQYTKSTGIWSFMEHQYDRTITESMMRDGSLVVGDDYSEQDVVSHFGWGTSGWDNGNTYFMPYNTVSNGDESTGYGPTDGTNYNYDLTGNYANADWGVYNAIANGGNAANLWRTLTLSEWDYVLNVRNTSQGIRYAKAIVNDVRGLLLLPDGWESTYYSLNNTGQLDAEYSTNVINLTDWETLEAKGAVFLPAAGIRYGNYALVDEAYEGVYWTATHYNSKNAYLFRFYKDHDAFTGLTFGAYNFKRKEGLSVRLVHDVQ